MANVLKLFRLHLALACLACAGCGLSPSLEVRNARLSGDVFEVEAVTAIEHFPFWSHSPQFSDQHVYLIRYHLLEDSPQPANLIATASMPASKVLDWKEVPYSDTSAILQPQNQWQPVIQGLGTDDPLGREKQTIFFYHQAEANGRVLLMGRTAVDNEGRILYVIADGKGNVLHRTYLDYKNPFQRPRSNTPGFYTAWDPEQGRIAFYEGGPWFEPGRDLLAIWNYEAGAYTHARVDVRDFFRGSGLQYLPKLPEARSQSSTQ